MCVPAAMLTLGVGVHYHDRWVLPQVLSHLILELGTQNFFPSSSIVPYFVTNITKLKIIFPGFPFN